MSAIETGIGTDIVVWFQDLWDPALGIVLAPFHFLGGEYGYLVVLPIIYWAVSKHHGKRLMILALGTSLVGQYLKLVFARPRPFEVSPQRVVPAFEQSGYGIPSGHTILGTVVAGYAWYAFPRAWVRAIAVAFGLLMGISRMVHGVHFPQDVLLGALLGLVMVAIFWWLDTRYSQRMAAWSVARKTLLAVVIAAAAFVLTLLVEDDLEHRKDTLSVVGALLGGLIGFALEHRYIRFSTEGALLKRIIRTLVGLLITVGIFVGLDMLYDVVVGEHSGVGALLIYVVRYALVSLFVAAGAPALFISLKLARSAQSAAEP